MVAFFDVGEGRMRPEMNCLAMRFNRPQTIETARRPSLASKLWDKKDVILKNEPEKLLKTQGKATWIAKNEPENEAEKLLKIGSCEKNEPKTNRKTNRTMLLKTKKG